MTQPELATNGETGMGTMGIKPMIFDEGEDYEIDLGVEIRTVTPDLAKAWLARRPSHQRKPRPRHVSHLARQISEGRWALNGQTIIFDEDNHLIDGQHRLLACIQADHEFRTFVIRGIRRRSFYALDEGWTRAASHALDQRGVKNANKVASALRLLWLHNMGKSLNSTTPKPALAEMYALYDACPDIDVSAQETSACRFPRTPHSVFMFAYYLMRRQDVREAREFLEQLTTGHDLGPTDPVLLLRNKLLRESNRASTRLDAQTVAHWIAAAWRMKRKGKTASRLNVPALESRVEFV